jgi:hypothetical protein
MLIDSILCPCVSNRLDFISTKAQERYGGRLAMPDDCRLPNTRGLQRCYEGRGSRLEREIPSFCMRK